MGEAMADGDMVHCDRHGPAQLAFVCQHLVGGSGLGFWHSGSKLEPCAWCSDCDALMMQTGHWTEEAEEVAGIKIVCRRCYANIRRRNRVQTG